LTSQQANLIRSLSLNDQGKPSKDKIEPIENKAKKYQHEDEFAKKKEETLNVFVDL